MDPFLLSPLDPSVPVALALSEGDVSQQVLRTKQGKGVSNGPALWADQIWEFSP